MRCDIIECNHPGFTKNAFRAKRIFFRNIVGGCSVLRPMTAWASEMNVVNHDVSLFLLQHSLPQGHLAIFHRKRLPGFSVTA